MCLGYHYFDVNLHWWSGLWNPISACSPTLVLEARRDENAGPEIYLDRRSERVPPVDNQRLISSVEYLGTRKHTTAKSGVQLGMSWKRQPKKKAIFYPKKARLLVLVVDWTAARDKSLDSTKESRVGNLLRIHTSDVPTLFQAILLKR